MEDLFDNIDESCVIPELKNVNWEVLQTEDVITDIVNKLLKYDELVILSNILYLLDMTPTQTENNRYTNLIRIISNNRIKKIMEQYKDLIIP